MKICAIDSEFRPRADNKKYDVVCICYRTETIYREIWIQDKEISYIQDVYTELAEIAEDHVFSCHYSFAEVWTFLSLGFNIDKWNFIDTFVEAKLLQNNDNKGKKRLLSLSDLCKSFGIYDYEENNYKDKMRKLILNQSSYSETERTALLYYCSIDANSSYELTKCVIRGYEKTFKETYNWDKAIIRGNYIKAASHAGWVGIPVDTGFIDDIKDNHRTIIKHFIDQAHEKVQYCYEENGLAYSFKAKKFDEVVRELKLDKKWKLSEKTGKFSTEGSFLKEIRGYHPFVESLYTTMKNIQSLKYLKPKAEMVRANSLAISHGKSVEWDKIVTHLHLFNSKAQISKQKFLDLIHTLQLDWDSVTASGKPSITLDKVYLFCEHHKEIDVLRELFEDLVTIEACKYLNKQTREVETEDGDVAGKDETIYDAIIKGSINIPFGTFGTVTGRNAPKAKFFPFAQSSWQRSMVRVPEGMKLVAFDYISQEIFVGAAFHKDNNMMKAYLSKDYYLYAGAMMGVIPKSEFDKLPIEELKVKYGKERKLLKGLILGLGYLMGVPKLAANLFPDKTEYQGKAIATKLSKQYRNAFSQFFKSGEQFVKDNKVPKMLHHWGHIGLEKSTTANNFPIQGSSAEILHLAMIKLSNKAHWKKGIFVFSPLHDAIYVFIKDDHQFEAKVQYVASQMQDATARILDYRAHKVKVGYQICEHGQTFLEKDKETVEKIHKLLNREYNLMSDKEHIVG